MTDAQATSTKFETWPGRFNVRAEIRYSSRRKVSGIMQVTVYQPDMPEEEFVAVLAEVGFTPEDNGWVSLVSQAKDTFSLEQSEALVIYLNSREGTTALWTSARLPTPGIIGASAIPALPSFRDGFVHRLYTERGYTLPFKVEAINTKTYIHMARLYNELRSTLT